MLFGLDIFTLGIGILAVSVLFFNIYLRKRLGLAVKIGTKIEEDLNRNTKKLQLTEQTLKRRDNELEVHYSRVEKIEKQLDFSQKEVKKLTKQIAAMKTSAAEEQNEISKHAEHLTQQVESLTSQLKESIETNKELNSKENQNKINTWNEINISRKNLENEIKTLKTEHKNIQTQFNTLTNKRENLGKQYKEQFDAFVTDSKAKTQKYRDLYTSMKNLKELSEDRLTNFEVASFKLAEWIISKNNIPLDTSSQSPKIHMITSALDHIGEEIFKDDIPSEPKNSKALEVETPLASPENVVKPTRSETPA